MGEEEILAVIKRHPEVIAEALERKPNALTGLILKLAPWDRFATKEDIRMLIEFIEKRFNAVDKRFEDINKRFEAIDRRFEELINYSNKRFEDLRSYSEKRFEDINKRFEGIDKRFEGMNRRFEDINKRFEGLTRYVDKRAGLVEKLLIGFNVPILIAVITILIRLILF